MSTDGKLERSNSAETSSDNHLNETIEDCKRSGQLSDSDIEWIIATTTPSSNKYVTSALLMTAMLARCTDRMRMSNEDSLSRTINDRYNGLFFDEFDYALMLPTGPPMLFNYETGIGLPGPSRCREDEDYFMRFRYPGKSPFPKKRLFSEREE